MLDIDDSLAVYKDFNKETLLHVAVKSEKKEIV